VAHARSFGFYASHREYFRREFGTVGIQADSAKIVKFTFFRDLLEVSSA
jgi:hypothetical protein